MDDTILVNIADREGDIYEYFYEAQKNIGGPKILVRAEKTRSRKTEGIGLWEKMERSPLAGYQEVKVPAKGGKGGRVAKLEVRFAKVELQPPKDKKELGSIWVWVVYTKEVDHPDEVKSPLEWMLITTVEVSKFEDATERIKWYACRWGIEVYHRTLKSGCRIEDRRLGDADSLKSCLAIDMVVAWRIYWLTKMGRETPDVPCNIFLKEEEWQALYAYVKKELPPEKPINLRDAVRMIASLGGFLGRKGDGEPGTTTIWRGLQCLQYITEGYWLRDSLCMNRAGP